MKDQAAELPVSNGPIPATCGRIVHYFPNEKDEHSSFNGANVLPAVVIQSFEGLRLNIQVFTVNPDGLNGVRMSVPHKSSVEADAGYSYWDWPQR